MGIEASYRRINAGEWHQLKQLLESASSLDGFDLYEAYATIADSDELRSSDRYLTIDKDWHALHAWKICDHASTRSLLPRPRSTPIHGLEAGTPNSWNRCSGSIPNWSDSSVMPPVKATWFCFHSIEGSGQLRSQTIKARPCSFSSGSTAGTEAARLPVFARPSRNFHVLDCRR